MKSADLDVLGANFKEISDAQKKDLEISYGLEIIKINAGLSPDGRISLSKKGCGNLYKSYSP